MSKKLKIIFFVILLLALSAFASFGDTRAVNLLFFTITAMVILYVIHKSVNDWKNDPKKILHGENFRKQVKLSNFNFSLSSNKTSAELSETLSRGDGKILYILDIISLVYWLVFSLLVFTILEPLRGGGQAQNGVQLMLLLFIAVPFSLVIFVILIKALLKKFKEKLKVDKIIWNKLLETLFLPILLFIIGIFIVISIAQPLYFNEPFYNFAKDNLFEPIIRAGIIIVLVFLINKNRIYKIFKIDKTSI